MSALYVPTFLFTLLCTGTCSYEDMSYYNEGQEACGAHEERDVEVCLTPMLDYASQLQHNGLLPLEGAKVFDELCSLYKKFVECTSGTYCRSLSIQAMQASYGYMCGQGYPIFARNVDCFAQVESNKEYAQCRDAATNGVNELQQPATVNKQYFSQLCGIMSQYLTCSQPVIVVNCGDEAWNIVKKVTKESLQVSMPDCNLGL